MHVLAVACIWMERVFLGVKLHLSHARWMGGPQAGDGHGEGRGLDMHCTSEFFLLPLIGVPLMMLGIWSLLLLWGLLTPCQGLLETVGTLARIDKGELGKGEPEVGDL